MIKRLLAWFFPSPLQLAPEELEMVLRYDARRHRAHPDEAFLSAPLPFMTDKPGTYVGFGNRIIRERRKRPRIK